MIQEEVDDNICGYVLITCEEGASDGNMQVKMTYQGDPVLVSYLLETAQKRLEQDYQESVWQIPNIS